MNKTNCILVLLIGAIFPMSVNADWINSYLFQSSGFENPLVRVGFNPQPEPPGENSSLTMNERTRPLIRIPDISITDGNARLVFGVDAPFEIDASGEPDEGIFIFSLLGGRDLSVMLELFTESGGIPIPGTWEGFNPQPEPPGLRANASSVGFDFQFSSNSPAYLRFQIFDQNNSPLSFSVVPEPTSIGFIVLSLLMVPLRRKRRAV